MCEFLVKAKKLLVLWLTHFIPIPITGYEGNQGETDPPDEGRQWKVPCMESPEGQRGIDYLVNVCSISQLTKTAEH